MDIVARMAGMGEEAEAADVAMAEREAVRAEAKETAASGRAGKRQINKTRFAITAARKGTSKHSAGQKKQQQGREVATAVTATHKQPEFIVASVELDDQTQQSNSAETNTTTDQLPF